MFSLLLRKYWLHIGVVILGSITLGFAYNYAYSKGYDAAAAKHQEVVDEYERKIADRISDLDKIANNLAITSDLQSEALYKEVRSIAASVRGRKLYEVKDGKCLATPEVIKAYNDLVDKVNSK